MMVTGSSARRRPPFPWFGTAQLWVTLALLIVLVGSFLPWWQTFLGPRWGLDTFGIWTLWAAATGLVGALSTRRWMFSLLPLVAGLVALGVVLWVGAEGITTCRPAADGSTPCRPGVGLVVTGAGAINVLLLMARHHLAGAGQGDGPLPADQ